MFGFSFPRALAAAVAAGAILAPVALGSSGPDAGVASSGGRVQSFHSQSGFHPPAVAVSSDPDTSSGDIFLSPNNTPQPGAMIINPQGQLVWFRRAQHSADSNLEVQRYEGSPVLTWWNGNIYDGHGINGRDVIMSPAYRVLHVVTAGHGYMADLHEFQIAPDGTALIDAYVPVHMDLTSYGGPRNGTVLDCVIQRIDIQTNRVLWEWHALQHIPLSDSYTHPIGSQPWDYFHLDSIQQQPNDNLLISSRYTWGVYLIGEKQGKVIWEMGGKHSSFKMGTGTKFEWQHDALLIGHVLSVFDDASDGYVRSESQSSGKQILVDRSAMTATLRQAFTHSGPVLSGSQGNVETLPDGNVFVGWGSEPDFSEYTPSGQQIFSGSFPLGVTSYRAFRSVWQGQPATPPSMANAAGRTGGVSVWASWNGATDVAGWRVLGGPSAHSLQVLDEGSKPQGFETGVSLHSEPPYFAVQAIGSDGRVLSTSAPHLDQPHLAIFGPTVFVHASNGYAGVPVGCATGTDCSISLRVRLKGAVVGQSSPTHVAGSRGSMLYVQLSSAARDALQRSSDHRVLLEVTARGASGINTTSYLTGIPYSTSGSGPSRRVSQTSTVQVANTTGFVGSGGEGSILTACYAPTPCELRATFSVGGTVVASTPAEHLGVDELGDQYFQLNSAGRALLAKAAGNQRSAQITLSDGGATATGQVVLVRYG